MPAAPPAILPPANFPPFFPQAPLEGPLGLAGVPLPTGRHTRFGEDGEAVTGVVHAVRQSHPPALQSPL